MAESDIATEHTTVDDRLLATLLLAGLFHLIVILGVSFAVPVARDSSTVPTLEVLLVGDTLPESPRNDEAFYLAERSQQGAGNTRELSRPQRPNAAEAPVDLPGETDGRTLQPLPAGPTGGESEVVASAGDAAPLRYAADAERPMAPGSDAPRQFVAGAATTLPSREDDMELRLKGPARRELMVTASTRVSEVAVYLDAWKRKVERIGTLNFPNQARRRALSGNPVLEVALGADGRLTEVTVRRSSGHPELDRAAVDILRLAAPFEPFSRELAARHDALRFAHEWQFVRGQVTGSAVNVAPNP